VLIINLIDYLGIESVPLGFPKFGIDALVLSLPLDVDLKVKKKQSYDLRRKFQVEWGTKLPWAKFQVGYDGYGKYVKCKIYFLKLSIKISSLHLNGTLSRNILVIKNVNHANTTMCGNFNF
jgi:hypothetical protein